MSCLVNRTNFDDLLMSSSTRVTFLKSLLTEQIFLWIEFQTIKKEITRHGGSKLLFQFSKKHLNGSKRPEIISKLKVLAKDWLYKWTENVVAGLMIVTNDARQKHVLIDFPFFSVFI